ncbi:MAG: hypothetical protein HUJ31_04695 [Pseudomonadales bacterium]|nr:hypothetical protein [Pseudomonadales bacterium]
MIGQNIDTDKLIADIDQQIEILTAIAGDNLILTEQLRLLLEARELILNQELEIERLGELIDPDQEDERLTIIDRESLRNQSEP